MLLWIKTETYPWNRLSHNGSPRPHAFVRDGGYVRTATVTYDATEPWVVSGVKDCVVLKVTDSEFLGYLHERYTTLQLTRDRVMATSVTSQWWHTQTDMDWGKSGVSPTTARWPR